MNRKERRKQESRNRRSNKDDEWFVYDASVGEEQKIQYIGMRPTKTLENENPVIRELDFAMNHFMEVGEIEVENCKETVKEKRDVVVEGLKKLTRTQKVDVTGVCVGFGDDVSTHFIVSFVHEGKLVSLKGYVADLETDYTPTTMDRIYPKPDLKVINGGIA